MHILITTVHVIAAIFLVLVVLLQSGKGGGMGSAFGGGAGNVFGARGAGNLLTKLTGASAIIFFLTSLTLSIMSSKTGSIVQDAGSAEPTNASAPAAASAPEAVDTTTGAASQPTK